MISEKITEANIWPTTRLGEAARELCCPGELHFQGTLSLVPPLGLSSLHSKGDSSYGKDKENRLHRYISAPVPHRQKQVYFLLCDASSLWIQTVLKAPAGWEVLQPSPQTALQWACRLQANPSPSFLLGQNGQSIWDLLHIHNTKHGLGPKFFPSWTTS